MANRAGGIMSKPRAPEYPPVADPEDQHPEEPKRVTTTEARQAVPTGHMRYVLGIGLALVILAFLIAYVAVV
jgi:hypothetical protein